MRAQLLLEVECDAALNGAALLREERLDAVGAGPQSEDVGPARSRLADDGPDVRVEIRPGV